MNSTLFSGAQIDIQRVEPVYVQIERELRNWIMGGRLKPGDRIPSAEKIAADMGVHVSTVQKALRRLVACGLVVRTPHLGTFVKSKGGDVQVAVVFGPSLADESAHFFRALLIKLREGMAEHGWSCRVYDGLNAIFEGSPQRQAPQLNDIRSDAVNLRFSGCILVGLDEKDVPGILEACGAKGVVTCGRGKDVQSDFHHFMSSSLAFLAEQGLRRIVYLRTFRAGMHGNEEDMDALKEGVKRLNLPDVDVIQLDDRTAHYDETADHRICREQVRRWTADGLWPEGLIMSDDITMRGLAHALLSCGSERANSVSVVTCANEGIDLHYGMPVARYLSPTSEVARNLLELLTKRMAGSSLGSAGIRVRGRICLDHGLICRTEAPKTLAT